MTQEAIDSITHKDYRAATPIIKFMRDVITGNRAIKENAKTYAPASFSDDQDRYNDYIKRSNFDNYTKQTKISFSGMVFRRPPKIVKIPDALSYIKVNCNGVGVGLEQFVRAAMDELLITSRYGILADAPVGADSMSVEEARDNMPYLSAYKFEDIRDWQERPYRGGMQLTRVLLREGNAPEVDAFGFDKSNTSRYRLLGLDDQGYYYQELYEADAMSPVPEANRIYPTDSNGQKFKFIPFYIVGGVNNDMKIDDPILESIAEMNVAHFQVMCDHRENLHVHGQITVGIQTGLTHKEFKEANPDGIQVGARAGHYLGEKGALHTITAPESSSLRVALKDLEDSMIAIGARIIRRGNGQEQTAEAARLNAGSESSILDVAVLNMSKAVEDAIYALSKFVGDFDRSEFIYSMNTEYWDVDIPSDSISAMVNLLRERVVGKKDVRDMLRSGRIEIQEGRTDEDIEQDLEENPPNDNGDGSENPGGDRTDPNIDTN